MPDMKNMELKTIDVASVFKFFGGIFVVVGLIVGLFGNLLGIDIMSADLVRIFPFIANVGPGIFTGILFGVLYGLSAAIGFSIFALLYNFFAAVFGGLKFGLKD